MILRPIKYAKMTFSAESFPGQVNFSFDNPAEKLSPIEKKMTQLSKKRFVKSQTDGKNYKNLRNIIFAWKTPLHT